MQCKELEAVLELEGLSPLPDAAREHLAGCPTCQGLLADLTSIVVCARTLPAEVAPPERVWISLRAQLQAEGIIQQPEPVRIEQSTPWWQNVAALFGSRVLAATAGTAIILASIAYFQIHKKMVPVASVQAPPVRQATVPPVPPSRSEEPAKTPVPVVAQAKPANAPRIHASDEPLRPSPSELAASTLLTNEEQDVPNMQLAGNSAVDASLRQNLRTVNEFIAECQQRLKQNPQDELAREYLYSAYQQKAELLSAMMESGRSEH
jgi:hypothetical protein